MNVAEFDFDLPDSLIALRPASPRDSARMLVVRTDGVLEHRHVRDLPEYLHKGDVLVVNDSRVIPARLSGHRLLRVGRPETNPRIEVTLHKRVSVDRFRAFAKPARKLEMGDGVILGDDLEATVSYRDAGEIELIFKLSGAALDLAIAAQGEMPLPPYIAGKRKPDLRDHSDYQTIFARDPGSVAAPTAGLHFTPKLLSNLKAKGVKREQVTLHVGAGTFLPVTEENTDDHRMHNELAVLDVATAERLNDFRKAGGRIAAVGTTSLRTLETAAREDGAVYSIAAETDIFITPGYRFKSAEILLTNFHLPRSTLFMLVCAFAGTDIMKTAYAEAIHENYRFYSYGDACLLFRPAS